MHKLQTYNTVDQDASINLNDVVLLNTMQAKTRYNIGSSLLASVAGDVGAVVRVGRRRLYSRKVLDDYFSAIAAEWKNALMEVTAFTRAQSDNKPRGKAGYQKYCTISGKRMKGFGKNVFKKFKKEIKGEGKKKLHKAMHKDIKAQKTEQTGTGQACRILRQAYGGIAARFCNGKTGQS